MDLFPLICIVVVTFSTINQVKCATLQQLVSSKEKNVSLELRSEASTVWFEWSQWSTCSNKHLESINCWENVNDVPKKTRTRLCSHGSVSQLEVCNRETIDCTELPSCPVDCVDLTGSWLCDEGEPVTLTQNGCTGSTSDGLNFTVRGSDVTITKRRGDRSVLQVNKEENIMQYNNAVVCTKTTVLWLEDTPEVYCKNNNKTGGFTSQFECQTMCETVYGCVGIAWSHNPAPKTCYACLDDILTSANINYGFYRRPSALETPSCVDIPGFKDKYGTTCEETERFGNCKDGKPGKYSEQRLKNDANSDGVSVLDACCVCGGGQKE